MDKGGGWIKVYRQIRDNWIWNDAEKLKAWIDLLMMVNHEDKKVLVNGKIIIIRRGQTLTSTVKLAERWGWSRNRIYRYIVQLKTDKMSNTHGTPYGTIVTIENYSTFQGEQINNGTTNETSDGTTVGTTDGTTVGTQTRIKELKKQRTNTRARAKFQNQRNDDLDGKILNTVLERLNDGEKKSNSV